MQLFRHPRAMVKCSTETPHNIETTAHRTTTALLFGFGDKRLCRTAPNSIELASSAKIAMSFISGVIEPQLHLAG